MRLNPQYGWMTYIGNLGGRPEDGFAVAGDVLDVEISVETGGSFVHDFGMIAPVRVPGSSLATVTTRLDRAQLIRGKHPNSALADVLATWPQPGREDGRRWPPWLRAMTELAQRHPDEFAALRAQAQEAEGLSVVADGWTGKP